MGKTKIASGVHRVYFFHMALTVCAASSIRWDFPGGRLAKVEQVADSHFRAHLAGETDQDGRNRQANWYFFRIDGARGKVTIDLVNLPGEYNYKPNRGAVTKDTPAVYSENGVDWKHVEEFEYDAAEPRMRLSVPAHGKPVWIAHTPPYTERNLNALEKWAKTKPGFRVETIGKTVDGRPLRLWTIGDGPRVAWLMFRQHSWETGSSWVAEGLVKQLLANPPKHLTVKMFPLCDPDGVERGGVRFNKFGYDLNRNWDVNGVEKMPEITAQRGAIKRWLDSGKRIDLFYSLHNTETSEYLEGPPGGAHKELAERFFHLLESETSFAPTRKLFFSETKVDAGRMVVIQGLYRDFQLPGFLMEQRISRHPKYGRLPLVEDRLRFGRELAVTIAKLLTP